MKEQAEESAGWKARASVIAAEIDRRLGPAVGRAVCAHHRRRLGRIDRLGAQDAPPGGWAAGDPPPRAGCSLEILVDGAEALTRIASELDRAESHVQIAGWLLSPDFQLTRAGEQRVVRNVLAELAEKIEVRVLLWAGAPGASLSTVAQQGAEHA